MHPKIFRRSCWMFPRIKRYRRQRESGTLGRDLLDRIDTYTLHIPPLKERKEDIFHFVRESCEGYKVTPHFYLALLRYDWPGNVRELIKALEKACERIDQPGQQSLTADLLDLKDDPSIAKHVQDMTECDAEQELYRQLVKTLLQQGFQGGKPGSPLFKTMADFLGQSQPTISRKARTYVPELF